MAVEAQYVGIFTPQLYKAREIMNTVENYGVNQQMGLMQVENRCVKHHESLAFLGEDISSQVLNHMLDVDRLLVQHIVNARTELSQKRKRFSSQIVSAAHEALAKQLRPKDEEIERLKRLNRAMEERIESLGVENNAWRYLAQTHEAAAAAIGANLERVLADQAAAAAAAEDAESRCEGGDNDGGCWRMKCRCCGDGEPSVLLLPCRHMCVCAACGPAVDACPICKCSMTGSVNVNLC